MISEKYKKHSVDMLKHIEITKLSTTYTNDISLESPSKVKYTLKFSALYLLSSSRKLIVNTLLKHVEIVKFRSTTKCDIFLDSSLKY